MSRGFGAVLAVWRSLIFWRGGAFEHFKWIVSVKNKGSEPSLTAVSLCKLSSSLWASSVFRVVPLQHKETDAGTGGSNEKLGTGMMELYKLFERPQKVASRAAHLMYLVVWRAPCSTSTPSRDLMTAGGCSRLSRMMASLSSQNADRLVK